MQKFRLESYVEQALRWPEKGRFILAQFDEDSIVVYQAYNAEIADFAVKNQRFGGAFSYSRMSWIKPNFLWMMYRSHWATSPNQERVLAIVLGRQDFEKILAEAVESSFQQDVHESRESWRDAIAGSEVRMQWDPDHDPHGRPVARRALQLGLRGEILRKFGEIWPRQIVDMTDFVHEQHSHVQAGRLDLLETPFEQVYSVEDPAMCARLRLDGIS